MLSKTKSAILTVLEETDEKTQRTRLVKLIYLADNMFYEHFGRTITGLEYFWDNHGPNCKDYSIVDETEELVQQDILHKEVGTSIYGTPNYLYSIKSGKIEIAEDLLSSSEKQVLRDMVNRYRNCSLGEIVSASKKTKPFKNASQYGPLEMQQSSEYTALIEAVKRDVELMAGIAEGTKAGAEDAGMPLEAVKQKYDL